LEKDKDLDKQYDLKASLKEIGVLYPALADAEGRIIDGIHRLAADPRWPIFQLTDIKTLEQYLVARVIANMHRRDVPAEEKTKWLDELAEKTGWTPEKIAKKVGMSPEWVRLYLSDQYKNQEMRELRMKREEKTKKKSSVVSLTTKESRPEEPSRPEPEPPTVSTPTPQPSKFETEKPQTPTRDPREKYIHGLDLWFIPPSNPVMSALYDYCIEKEVDWRIVVVQFLGKCLVEEGFLEKEKLTEILKPFIATDPQAGR
jgi:hypothetical protein